MRMNRTKTIKLSASRQKGYLLLSVMLLITLMLIALAVAAPRIAQQIQRQKEEEMVRRGKQYALAIKKFYHKNGTYPLSLDQLENTNHQRFLRQRYKDPMTTSGEWKLIHVGEAQITIPTAGGSTGQQAPGQTGSLSTNFPPTGSGLNSSAPTSPGGLNSGGLNAGGLNQGGLNPGGIGGGLNSGGLSGGLNSGGLSGGTPASGSTPGAAGGAQTGGQMGTLQTSNIGSGLGANAQGGGPIIGVVSTSKGKGIKEFNGVSEYNHWLFVYDPRLEQAPGGGGITVASPRSATPTSGAVPAGVIGGSPANPPTGSTAAQPGMPNPTPSPGISLPTPAPGMGTPAPPPAPSPTPLTPQ
jgi:type II secretory pathway pseudopilin PulG